METKKQFKYFTIAEHEKEQDYLRMMHKSGWKFVKIGGFCVYHFEECAPEDVIYQLDYNEDRVRNKEEYVKLFNDCGWEYPQDYVGYSYFRKPISETNGEEEIFCDDDSRLQMMERVFRGRVIALLILFFCILIPQFINNLLILHSYFITVLLSGVLLLYIVVFGKFAKNYYNYKKNVRK